MKTNVSHNDSQKADKSEAVKQAPMESILQAYKQGTAQLASVGEGEPIQPKENKTGLPDNLKSGVENLSGHSLNDVKVHYNSSQPASLQAHAYAQGTDIHVAPGQEKHLPHEAWHVVQQKQGRVQPTKQLKGKTNINDDVGLEKEADVMGAKAIQLKDIIIPQRLSPGNKGERTIQRAEIPEELLDHKKDLTEVMEDISGVENKNKKTDQPLEDSIGGSENWANETAFAAKRKYVEYLKASKALRGGAENVQLGTDIVLDSDIQYSQGGKDNWVESKLVSGDWPQFGVNVLAARQQCALRTLANGVGTASITLTKDFFTKAKESLGLDENQIKEKCRKYLTSSMRKKFESNKNTTFSVEVFFEPEDQSKSEKFDVTKWHQ